MQWLQFGAVIHAKPPAGLTQHCFCDISANDRTGKKANVIRKWQYTYIVLDLHIHWRLYTCIILKAVLTFQTLKKVSRTAIFFTLAERKAGKMSIWDFFQPLSGSASHEEKTKSSFVLATNSAHHYLERIFGQRKPSLTLDVVVISIIIWYVNSLIILPTPSSGKILFIFLLSD